MSQLGHSRYQRLLQLGENDSPSASLSNLMILCCLCKQLWGYLVDENMTFFYFICLSLKKPVLKHHLSSFDADLLFNTRNSIKTNNHAEYFNGRKSHWFDIHLGLLWSSDQTFSFAVAQLGS